ncbi:hypothetical protein [Dendronalium sp. ChiSLP03b]|uniref:hypothetical protein n=1 Tax=Dendronalium sp. ChiSLP03b TaxID=3075381 RepID=UPI002AD5971D|nr:hypothetical protein [Dendronalium sp. ChiSLP03b]MDZ8208958.1 hypothetical protein [Dendronalium sp. ChiSLP03b]
MKVCNLRQATVWRFCLVALTASVTLCSCTPEKRAMLRLTAENFRDQAVDAITSVKKIYELNEPLIDTKTSNEFVVEQLLNDPSINFRSPREVNKIITRENQQHIQPSDLDKALDDLKAEYDISVEIFNKLETIDFGSAKLVERTATPARCLTVKMLLLAKQIQEHPPKPSDPRRVNISFKLQHLREQYRSLNVSSQPEAESIKNQVAEQVNEWLKVNATEQQVINESISKLLTAADTGQKLSKLIDEYPHLKFEVIATRVTQIIGITSRFTGRDYSEIATKINIIEKSINEDSTLNKFLKETSFGNRQTQLQNPRCQ